MLKPLLIFINFLGIFILSLFPGQDLNVKIITPTQVNAGEEFEVTLVIEKGDLQSFSRFTQELPAGLTAKRISSANADFSFEEQRLRLIWLKLPAEPSISVSYSISVDRRLKGSFTLGGEFAYVQENQRQTMDLAASEAITIIPDASLADSLRVDISESASLFASTQGGTGSGNLVVERGKPEKTGAYQYRIQLKITKGDLQKFAKIEEYIPKGYRAVEGDSKDGIFSYSQGVAKILWMNLPESSEFMVDYYIIPDPGVSIDNLKINGSFSYITGNTTQTVPVNDAKPAADVTLTEVKNVLPEKDTTPLVEKTPVDSSKIQVQKPDEKNLKTQIVESTPKTIPTASGSEMLQPEQGIYYRVQLAAGHGKVNIEPYFRKLNVKDEVKMEFHEGWRKYTTGSFKVYKEARDYRVMIWDTTPIKGAFVSAYDNGKRITVQEALMVTNQPWYR